MKARHLGCALMTLLAGCAVPYDPEPVRHDVPLPANAFAVVLDIVRDRFPRIVESDPDTFRIQTGWLAVQHGDVPGFRRASVFRGADQKLRVVVEFYAVQLGPGGPEDSAIEGDRRAEAALAGAIERALGG